MSKKTLRYLSISTALSTFAAVFGSSLLLSAEAVPLVDSPEALQAILETQSAIQLAQVNPQPMIAVNGEGESTITADTAEVTLVFLTADLDELFAELMKVYEQAVEEGEITAVIGDINRAVEDLEPVTEADLAPILAALAKQGFKAEDLEIDFEHQVWAAGPVSNIRGAGISFQMQNPSEEKLEALSDSVDDAIAPALTGQFANNPKLFLVERRAYYSTNNCETLEEQAYEAAVADARKRANVIARALNVELSEVPSVEEPAGEYSYYQSDCNDSSSYDEYGYGYDLFEAQEFSPPEITLTRSLRVTYVVRE